MKLLQDFMALDRDQKVGLVVVYFCMLVMLVGIYFSLWLLWSLVMPLMFPAAPASFTQPTFAVFAGAWFLVCLMGKAILR